MLSTPDGPFINISRLNLNKYAQKNALARSLFEFIFHHENDVRHVRSACCLDWVPVSNRHSVSQMLLDIVLFCDVHIVYYMRLCVDAGVRTSCIRHGGKPV